ncbi:actin-like ATPase domain-containing protein [Fistulina hepatica ATCC 64428]|uniref:Actin-like ATPase domain-containing protein n=1 Tax=Fistulina hepatica ATCC 64428 TaxID=1128425 RepID=A0A0D7ANP1_9AGAR|nr:actin-like ATPase domain-containing protein [Fistulina hepatica ATCC 64428]
MAFHDATVVIIETSRTDVYSGQGLHELLRPPVHHLRAQVGLKRPENGGTSEQKPTVNDYLVGPALDEALVSAGDQIDVFFPFENGDISDWTQAEALWRHALFRQISLRRLQNESPVVFSIATGLPRSSYERICQMFFERFNVAAFTILERPMAQIYATSVTTGVVIDIDYHKTDVTPVLDGIPVLSARVTTTLGMHDCEIYLANLLRSNQSVMTAIESLQLSPADQQAALLELVRNLWKEGHIKPPSHGEMASTLEDEGVTDIAAVLVAGKEKAVIESGMKRKLNAKASAAEQARAREIEAMDLLTVTFRETSITLGKERHRYCEPLYDTELALPLRSNDRSSKSNEPCLSLQDAVALSISKTDSEQHRLLWQGLFVTGNIALHIRGIALALKARCAPYIRSPDLLTDMQPKVIQVTNVPEYYSGYRETGDGHAAFLGSSIIAKIVLQEPSGSNYVSKADYSAMGPHSIIEMSAALL